ncbi:MAG TPA: hypothetical protein H9937_08160 [Candidatus Alistipes stercorigallinarum]|nr:hypothetical protein [Candidatus Alistipes stercorigallinarum]
MNFILGEELSVKIANNYSSPHAEAFFRPFRPYTPPIAGSRAGGPGAGRQRVYPDYGFRYPDYGFAAEAVRIRRKRAIFTLQSYYKKVKCGKI